jgi:transposase
MLLSEGQMSDHRGAALMLAALPPARVLIGDNGYDSDRFRQALATRGIEPCIPSRRGRKQRIPRDRTLYRQRHRIETILGRIKDWCRVAMRYNRCARAFSRPSASPAPFSSGLVSPKPSTTLAG